MMRTGHACIGVAELLRNDAHGDARHSQRARVGMTQNVEADGGRNLHTFAGFAKGAGLLRCFPQSAVIALENERLAFAPGREFGEKLAAFVSQHDMTGLSPLGLPPPKSTGSSPRAPRIVKPED